MSSSKSTTRSMNYYRTALALNNVAISMAQHNQVAVASETMATSLVLMNAATAMANNCPATDQQWPCATQAWQNASTQLATMMMNNKKETAGDSSTIGSCSIVDDTDYTALGQVAASTAATSKKNSGGQCLIHLTHFADEQTQAQLSAIMVQQYVTLLHNQATLHFLTEGDEDAALEAWDMCVEMLQDLLEGDDEMASSSYCCSSPVLPLDHDTKLSLFLLSALAYRGLEQVYLEGSNPQAAVAAQRSASKWCQKVQQEYGLFMSCCAATPPLASTGSCTSATPNTAASATNAPAQQEESPAVRGPSSWTEPTMAAAA